MIKRFIKKTIVITFMVFTIALHVVTFAIGYASHVFHNPTKGNKEA